MINSANTPHAKNGQALKGLQLVTSEGEQTPVQVKFLILPHSKRVSIWKRPLYYADQVIATSEKSPKMEVEVFTASYFLSHLDRSSPEAACASLVAGLLAAKSEKWDDADREAAEFLLIEFVDRNLNKKPVTKLLGIESSKTRYETILKEYSEWLEHQLDEREKSIKLESHKSSIKKAIDAFSLLGPAPKFGYAILTAEEKKSCHQHLNDLRETIDRSSLDTEKKNAILSRINQLKSEIDKDITPVEGFSALIGDILIACPGLAQKAGHAANSVRRLIQTVLGRSAADQGVNLGAADDLIRISAPTEGRAIDEVRLAKPE